MNAMDLIAGALDPLAPPETPQEGVCCVTGERGPTIARKHVIKPSFTSCDLLRCPGSDRASVSAWRTLTYKWERMSSWICDGAAFTRLDRQGVRAHVLAEEAPGLPTVCYATTSYKKHGSLLTPVNGLGSRVWVFETRLVDCTNRARVSDIWGRLRAAQDAGIARPLIESLDISPSYMGRLGWRVWQEFDKWARPLMRSPLYVFLTYLLPSKAELKAMKEAPDGQQ